MLPGLDIRISEIASDPNPVRYAETNRISTPPVRQASRSIPELRHLRPQTACDLKHRITVRHGDDHHRQPVMILRRRLRHLKIDRRTPMLTIVILPQFHIRTTIDDRLDGFRRTRRHHIIHTRIGDTNQRDEPSNPPRLPALLQQTPLGFRIGANPRSPLSTSPLRLNSIRTRPPFNRNGERTEVAFTLFSSKQPDLDSPICRVDTNRISANETSFFPTTLGFSKSFHAPHGGRYLSASAYRQMRLPARFLRYGQTSMPRCDRISPNISNQFSSLVDHPLLKHDVHRFDWMMRVENPFGCRVRTRAISGIFCFPAVDAQPV